MRRLLHCFFFTAVALVHSFTAGPSSSSPSSRMAVVAGRSIASRQWQPQRPTTYLCTASKDDDTQPQQRPNPKTFREGEVLGLRLMQGGKHDEALEGEFFTCVICLVDTSAFLYTKQYTSLTPRNIHIYIYTTTTSLVFQLMYPDHRRSADPRAGRSRVRYPRWMRTNYRPDIITWHARMRESTPTRHRQHHRHRRLLLLLVVIIFKCQYRIYAKHSNSVLRIIIS